MATKAEGFPDPRAEAREYLASTGCLDLFQELGTLLMYHKPDDPRAFLVEQLKNLQEKQKTEVLGSSIFTDDDVCTMFGMFDPTGKGKISRDQCKQGRWRGEYSFPIWFSIRGAETRARSRGVMAGMWVGCCDFSPARRGSVLSGETFFFCILSVDSRFDFQLLFGV